MNTDALPTGLIRIGTLSQRTGISPDLLRAWERRYGLLEPERTEGGFRLYRPEDLARVERMKSHMASGLSASQAARSAIAEDERAIRDAEMFERESRPDASVGAPVRELGSDLEAALVAYDEPAAQRLIDRALADYRVPTVLRDVILPLLGRIGDRWERGEVTVAQEHFASSIVRGRLLGLARDWGGGDGPRAILASAPTELHDLGLICFGVALAREGWRITYLGPDTPIPMIERTVRALDPQLVVVLGTTDRVLRDCAGDLRRLAAVAPLRVAGAGASAAFADELGAAYDDGDPVTVAERLTVA